MSDVSVGTAGHQLGIYLLRHRHAPVAPDMDACGNRKSHAQRNEQSADRLRRHVARLLARRGLQGVTNGGDLHGDDDQYGHHKPNDQVAPPHGAPLAALGANSRDSPIDDEDEPERENDPVRDWHEMMIRFGGSWSDLFVDRNGETPAAAAALKAG